MIQDKDDNWNENFTNMEEANKRKFKETKETEKPEETVDPVETVVNLANALATLSNDKTEDILASVNFNENISPDEAKPIIMILAKKLGKLIDATPEEVLEGVGYEED